MTETGPKKRSDELRTELEKALKASETSSSGSEEDSITRATTPSGSLAERVRTYSANAPQVYSTLDDAPGFDRARWRAFVEKLEDQLNSIPGAPDNAAEIIERFKDPEYLSSSVASLKAFADDPRNHELLQKVQHVVARAQEAKAVYDAASPEDQERWQNELIAASESTAATISAENPLATIASVSQTPDIAEAFRALEKASMPNVTIPDKVIPPGLSELSWSGIMWAAAVVSTLATAWGVADTAKSAMREYTPEMYQTIDQAMRSIGSVPVLGELTVSSVTTGVGLALSFLISVGIKMTRDQLATTGFQNKTGFLGAMGHNPTAALAFMALVGASGSMATKGILANMAKAQQTQEFAGAALKEISPVVKKTNTTYENAKAFNVDFDRYLFLLVKEEGEALSATELTEKQSLAQKGWNFPKVDKSAYGPKAITKAFSIDGRTVTPETVYKDSAATLKARVIAEIPADRLPLRKYSQKRLGEINLEALSESVAGKLKSLKSNLEVSASNKYLTAFLMFLGFVNADPQTAQDTLGYAQKDIEKIPAESVKLKQAVGDVGSSYTRILQIIQGGSGGKLEVVLPILPAADDATRKEIIAAFERIKKTLPERPASLWIPNSDWDSAMEFLSITNTERNQYITLGSAILLYGFIDVILAFLYAGAQRKKKEYLDQEVPKKYEAVSEVEGHLATSMLRKLEAVRPTIHAVFGYDPARVDLEYVKAMIRRKGREEVPELAEFAEWEKTIPPGSAEYLKEINTRRNELIPIYGAWLAKFAHEMDDQVVLPMELIGEAYPEYLHASEYLKAVTDPNRARDDLVKLFYEFRQKARREGADKDQERLEQTMRSIVAEEAARQDLAKKVEQAGEQSEFVKQLYSGVVFPLQGDAAHRITTLLGQNDSLLQLQYVTEKQRIRRRKVQETLKKMHPSIRSQYKDWLTPEGDIRPPEKAVQEFVAQASNPESMDYALLEQTKASLQENIYGDVEKADFNQAHVLDQLNFIRTHFTPHVENRIAANEILTQYTPEVSYGVDTVSGRPTVLVTLYDPNEDIVLVRAAFPGRVPDMASEHPEEVNQMLTDWFDLTVENELVMRLHTHQLDLIRNETLSKYNFKGMIDLSQIDLTSFPYDELVQFTVETQRVNLLRERTDQDLLYNPITEKEMETLRFGDIIAIRGYRPFEGRVIQKVFTALVEEQRTHPELKLFYNVENRTLHVRDTKTQQENSVPLIYFRDASSFFAPLHKEEK